MQYLAEQGVKIQHPSVLTALDQAGAQVDIEAEIVRFPRELVEAALKTAPKSFTLAAPIPKSDLALPHPTGDFYFCTGTGARGIIDPDSGDYRQLTVSDVQKWGRLVNALDNIDLCAFPTPTDAPPETVDVHSLRALLENSSKHIWIQPHTKETLPYLFELAAARAGSREGLAERPIVRRRRIGCWNRGPGYGHYGADPSTRDSSHWFSHRPEYGYAERPGGKG